MKLKTRYFFVLTSSFLLLSGCFKEPVPAYTQVAPENRVYLKEQGLTVLTAEAVFSQGLVFVGTSNPENAAVGATSEGSWTNLSALVASLDPKSLDYLNLDRNALTNVGTVASFTGLKWLRLNGNRLTELPDLSQLSNLRRIYLANNRLPEVPATLQNLPELTDIDLSGNPVKEVPAWLAEKKGLQNLSFSRTQVTKLPENLSAWENLATLQLGDLNLAAEEMARIRKALPNVRIVF